MKLKPEMLWIAGTANASSRNVFAAVIVLIAVVLIIGILLRIRKSLARKAQPPVTEKTAEPAPSYPYVVRPLVSFQTS